MPHGNLPMTIPISDGVDRWKGGSGSGLLRGSVPVGLRNRYRPTNG